MKMSSDSSESESESESESKSRLIDEFRNVKEIGSGGFGEVFKCEHLLDTRTYAVKKIQFDEKEKEKILREVVVLSLLYHENIVRYHQAWIEKSVQKIGERDESVKSDTSGELEEKEFCLFIQMEYCPGCLAKELEEMKSWDVASRYFLEIVQGLAFIHAKGIIHRDLCPQNILLTDSKTIKITDFGLAKMEDKTSTCSGDDMGHTLYKAPEMKEGSEITNKVDIFSLGIIMYELFHPFGGTVMERIKVLEDLNNKKTFPAKEDLTDSEQKLRNFILKLLSQEPNQRPSATEILENFSWPENDENDTASKSTFLLKQGKNRKEEDVEV